KFLFLHPPRSPTRGRALEPYKKRFELRQPPSLALRRFIK
ncbi:hypothetical protein LINPERPRIM_LOCUS37782, partial [Linum perenne]